MKSQMIATVIVLAASAMTSTMPMSAHADTGAGVIWAANPAGMQAMPNAQALALLPSSGYVPLQTSGGKCLLVARRGTQIVAIELSPLAVGAKVIGWKPQQIDMSTLTSKWGYQPLQSSLDAKSFGNPVTSAIAESSRSTWSNGQVDAHSSAIASGSGETESAGSVTVNGKTYRNYSHFKPATPEAPVAASDEYFCP